jgi:hypothetical protein
MRAFEFLTEEDPQLSDQELRSQIIATVNTAERPMLIKFYDLLDSGDVNDKLEIMLSGENVDKDAARIKSELVKIFLTTKGTAKDKNDFIQQFPKGFINVEELLTPASSVTKWFTGNNFSQQVFQTAAATIRNQGIGPGEYALAAFSPLLKSVGLVGGGGDLIYGEGENGIRIEVKGKVKSWGRLHDAKKMDYDMKTIKRAFAEAGIDQPTLTALQWITLRNNLDDAVKENLSKIVVDNLFTHVNDELKTNLVTALRTGQLADIKSEWGKLSFINYKNASGFSGILFYDVSSGSTRYLSDPTNTTFGSDAPQLYGAERDAMPKVWIEG